jgi:hypothetical protein
MKEARPSIYTAPGTPPDKVFGYATGPIHNSPVRRYGEHDRLERLTSHAGSVPTSVPYQTDNPGTERTTTVTSI